MRFLIDSMLPPRIADLLNDGGHDATAPARLGAHNLPDDVLAQIATAENRIIVTENAGDFAHVTICPIVLVRKSWWPAGALATRLAKALETWAADNPEPGTWPHWLPHDLR